MVFVLSAVLVVLVVVVWLRRPMDGESDLVGLFGGTEDEALRDGVVWARSVLQAQGISAVETPVLAVRELRRAKPALSLLGGKLLVDELRRDDRADE